MHTCEKRVELIKSERKTNPGSVPILKRQEMRWGIQA